MHVSLVESTQGPRRRSTPWPPRGLKALLARLPAREARMAAAAGLRGQRGRAGAGARRGRAAGLRPSWGWARAAIRSRWRPSPRSCPPGTYRLGECAGYCGGDHAGARLGARHLRFHALPQGKRTSRAPGSCCPRMSTARRSSRIAEGGISGPRSHQHAGQRHGPGRTCRRGAARWPSSHGAKVSVIVGEALLKRNFPLIHAVGRGSARAPRLIDLQLGPAGRAQASRWSARACASIPAARSQDRRAAWRR